MRTQTQWQLASVALRDACTDFIFGRQAMNCTASTLQFYRHTVGVFLSWCEVHNVHSLDEIIAYVVKQYVTQLVNEGKKDTTVWDHARAIKTTQRFWRKEGYIANSIKYDLSHNTEVKTHISIRSIEMGCEIMYYISSNIDLNVTEFTPAVTSPVIYRNRFFIQKENS